MTVTYDSICKNCTKVHGDHIAITTFTGKVVSLCPTGSFDPVEQPTLHSQLAARLKWWLRDEAYKAPEQRTASYYQDMIRDLRAYLA